MIKIAKIFLPKAVFYLNNIVPNHDQIINLYGTTIIKQNEILFYIVPDNFKTQNNIELDHVGQISPTASLKQTEDHKINLQKEFLYFTKSNEKSILLHKIHFQDQTLEPIKIHILVYDQLSSSFTSDSNKDELYTKFKLTRIVSFITKCLRFVSNTRLFIWLCWLFYPLVHKTAVSRHFSYWHQSFIRRERVYTILLDIAAGISIMIWLFYLEKNPSHYLLSFTEIIVNRLRGLLDSLKGSPVGLKLNVELNNFFLGCFMYHIDLWSIFLVIVSPVIQYLYIPLAILGCFGLSFQLAILCDLLHLISLHAHCFYIYAAVLYHIELTGISALWRVIRGRRYNPLKKRVESHDYSNSQLYLATLFFAALLFLLPTIITYYAVFATLRFCLYCTTYFLFTVQRRLLSLTSALKFDDIRSSFEMKYLQISSLKTNNICWPVSAFCIQIVPSPFIKSIQTPLKKSTHKQTETNLLSIDKFFIGLITSNNPFILNK